MQSTRASCKFDKEKAVQSKCFLWFALALIPFIFTGNSYAGQLEVKNPWVKETIKGAPAAVAYMVLENHGLTNDKLLSASTSSAKRTGFHEITMKGGMVEMNKVKHILVPAGGRVELEPKGLHLMMVGLNHVLKEGDTILLTLTFENAGEIIIEAPVRKAMDMKYGG